MDSKRSGAEITPMVLTFNEAANLERMLPRLSWAHQILVLDSYSTDDTVQLARSFPQVRVIQRRFDTFANQCNFGLQQITSPWVLSLDADYLLSERLARQIQEVDLHGKAAGYAVRFRYWTLGQALRASLYPPRTVLFRRDRGRYVDEGHAHRVHVEGSVETLSGWMEHDDRKPFDRWLQEQTRYAIAEARYLSNTPKEFLNFPDRLRRKIALVPALIGPYTLLAKGVILDGWPGIYYAFQRVLAEVLLSMRLIETRRKSSGPNHGKDV